MRVPLLWVFLLLLLFSAISAGAGTFEMDPERRYSLADGCLEQAESRVDVQSLLNKIMQSPDFSNFQETERNRIVLCRELGLRSPVARLAWPSFGNTLEIHVADTIPQAEADEAVRLITAWSRRVRSDQGIDIAFPVTVIVGDTAESLYPLVLQHGPANVTWESFQDVYDGTCSKRDTTSGWAAFNHLVICLEPGDKDLIGLEPVFIHEEIHVIQYQLSGQPEDINVQANGPRWLLEGTAEFPALVLYGGQEVPLDFSHMGLKLRDIETYGGFNNSLSGNGDLMVNAAVAVLLEGRSYRTVFEFYEALGKGEPWQDAFANTFGLTVEEFYTVFENRLLAGGE